MNNGLTQIGNQLKTIWLQLGGGQRLTLIVTALAVIMGLSGLVMWSARPDYALLYGKLDDAESSKVIAALTEAGVPYQTSRGGGSISVPSDKVYQMRMQLASKGIPRGEGVGFEIFDKPNFGISDFVQRANYLRAVQGELSRTIGQLDSIESARVMIVMPENRLLVDNSKKPTASVFVRVRGNATLPQQNVNAIRFLVANAVEGLVANNVSVVDNLGNMLSENAENDSMAGLTATQLNSRQNMEKYLAKKAEDMLNKVLGVGQSVVRVSADINFDSLTKTEEKYDPEGAIPRNTTITDDQQDTLSTTSNGGVAGISANSSSETNSAASSPSNTSKVRKKVATTSFEINKTVSSMIQTPGSMRRISAAVFVASNVKMDGTNRVVSTRTPEEMLKIKRVVQGALGIQEGPDATRPDQITIEEIAFNEGPAMEITKQLDQQQKKDFWWDLAKAGIYPLLGVIVLFVFWRMFKSTPLDNVTVGGLAGGMGSGRLFRPRDSDVVTVEVLNQLIRENPHNMTQAIRSWMGAPKEKV
ncbi:MAG: flagellar M-ring protein FliF [Verrucomicrobia bacterium]|jgi:flagellar M-ring protein FliF|nr:MAG: flagellar M-ring protein FliF [Verrucomicrobiota bacterium]